MGEKIKNLSDFCIGQSKVKIELNDGYSSAYSKYDIHIQSNSLQYSLNEKDFMILLSIFNNARKELNSLKEKK